MKIDVYQDTICPWCRIGSRNLQLALEQWHGEPVTVRLRPFELRPDMALEGRDFSEHMAEIKGDRNLQPMFDRVCQAGEGCDLTFRFDKIERMPNTLRSHVLIQAAPGDRQDELLEAVHRAYFEDGRDVGDRETLLAIAEESGLERVALAAKLDDPGFVQSVAEQAAWARRQGITGVPFFVFDDAVAVSGAQPPQVLLSAIQQAATAGVRR
jgi:predicted DsbA family dithiol-disulfide isomerase